jgi:hypothetical protein
MGRTITDTVTERFGETIDAAMVDPTAAQLLRSGRLTSALRHVGFGVVDEIGEPARVTPLKPPWYAAPARSLPRGRRPSLRRRQPLRSGTRG